MISHWLDKTLMGLFLFLLAFTALAHGAVEPWSLALSSVTIVGLLLLWACQASWEKNWTIAIPAPFWPLLALLGWGVVQSYQWGDDASKPLTISLDAEATRAVVLWLGLLLITILVAANLLLKRERWQSLQRFCTFFGLALALFALVQQATWNGRFYWWRTINTEEISAPFGPFVHHGHYAGYLELLLPIPLALLLVHRMRLEQKLLYGFAAAMMGVSVIASLARGGMLTLMAQLGFLAVASYWVTQRQQVREYLPARASLLRAGGVIAMGMAIVLGVLWIGAEPVINRLMHGQVMSSAPQTETFFSNRGWIWRDTWTMFRANPITGVGLGAFESTFPQYSQGNGAVIVNAAHNDYLQILAEGGLVGGAIMLWFVVAVLRSLVRAMKSRDSQAQALALGAGTGLIGILVHSIVDFNLQIPSHALLVLTLIALVSQLAANVAAKPVAVAAQQPHNYFPFAPRWPQRDIL